MGFFEGANRGFDRGVGLGASMYKDEMGRQAEAEALKRQEIKDKQAQSNFERELALKKGGKGGMPPGVKLGVDQRWNPETETAEIIPGSKTYQGQAEKYAKDQQTLSSTRQKVGGSKKSIEEFEAMPGAVESQFGGYNALVGRYLPGAADAKARLGGIQASIRSAGLDMMRQGGSIGQMTEREWPMVEQLMANITPTMSEEEARFQLEKVKAKMDQIEKEAARIQEQEWGQTPFTQPMRTGPKGFVPSQPPGNQVAPATGIKKYSIISVE